MFSADVCVGFQHQQTLTLQSSQPQLYNLVYDSKSGLLLLGNTLGSTLVVLHVTQNLDSFDSIAKFEVVAPIISLEAIQSPAESSDPDAIQVIACNRMTAPKPRSLSSRSEGYKNKAVHGRVSRSCRAQETGQKTLLQPKLHADKLARLCIARCLVFSGKATGRESTS